MKNKHLHLKKALHTALFVLLLGAVGMTKGYAQVIGGMNLRYSFNFDDFTATVTGHEDGHYATGSLVIPSSVKYRYIDHYDPNGNPVYVTRTFTVTTIGWRAFEYCTGLTGNLTIGNSVTTIGWRAFEYCTGLTGNLTIGNSVTTIGEYAFYGCSGFTGSLTIGNSVTTIEGSAFSGCSGFTGSLTIGNSVTTIGESAFSGCSSFTGSLTIPNSVTTIGEYAFSGCSSFTGSLTIPNSVTTIDDYAFKNCSGFSEVHYNVTNPFDIGEYPFNGCGGTLIIGDNVQRIPVYMFYYANFIGDLVIPNSVTEIGFGAFAGCRGFTGSLTIPNSVTTIEGWAFKGCTGFTGSLTIPNSVTVIGNWAFKECTGFTGSLTIPNSVTVIGDDAFDECSGFTGSLTIPNSVTSIGIRAFCGCSGFTGSLTIGNSVTSIGVNAFALCNGFTEVHYNATNCTGSSILDYNNNLLLFIIGEDVEALPDWIFDAGHLQCIKSNATVPPVIGANTFINVRKDIPVIVPCGTMDDYVEIYQAAPYWSEFTNIRESEYALVVRANPDYLGTAVIVQEPTCHNFPIIHAIPNPHCSFVNWTHNGEEFSRISNFVFPLEEDMILVANFEAHKRFFSIVSFFWSDPNNWVPYGVPTDTMSVDLQSDVIIDTNVVVGSVFVHDNHVLTIMPGATLTVTEDLESPSTSNIVIEDGGQLLHSNEDVYATVKKTAKAHDDLDDNWSLISYPFLDSVYASSWGMQSFLSNDYDLYYYNEPTHYWNNYKQTDNDFYYLEAGKGYLYANSGVISPNGIQIGEGTGSTRYSPFYTVYNYSISENLFRANEFAAAGLGTEPLGALCWYATNAPGYEQSNISIWMANVSDSELTETSHVTDGMTLVYSGSITPSLGWNEFAFNESSFAWDGTSNVLICVQRNNGEWNSGVYWQSHETNFAAMSYAYTDNSEYDMTSQAYSMSTNYTRPNIVFETAGQVGQSEYHPVTLSFAGKLAKGSSEISVPLSRTEGINLAGLNLVGNPFACNAYLLDENHEALPFFKMNDAGDAIVAAQAGTPIKPCEGVFVICPNDRELHSAIFTTTAPASLGNTQSVPPVSLPLHNLLENQDAFNNNSATQTVALSRGWNWYSTYIEQEGIDGLSQLENSIGVPNAIIQSQGDGYVKSILRNGRILWGGALTTINNEEMYKIGTKYICEATMEGQVTNPAEHPITINKGWNWIGFPCSESVSVNVALSGFNPKNNDVIKGIHSYATFSNGTWSGTLNTLEPGQGYMYGSRSNTPKTLVFQTGREDAPIANITPENNFFQPSIDYADNMTVVAVVELNGEELRSEDYELAAFVGDECRGSVKLMYVEPIDRYVAFLTVFGEQEEDLHFRLTDGIASSLSTDRLAYTTDDILGALDNPVVLHFGPMDVEENALADVKVYPNPSEGVFNIEGQNIKKVEVFNALGQPVYSKDTENGLMMIDLTNHATGIYLIRVVTDNGIWSHQIMKR